MGTEQPAVHVSKALQELLGCAVSVHTRATTELACNGSGWKIAVGELALEMMPGANLLHVPAARLPKEAPSVTLPPGHTD
jgi:hypothetical protein